MTSHKAKICKECGSLDWKQSYSSSVYGMEENSARPDGHYNENFDHDDDLNDWEESGDPMCMKCESDEIVDIDDLNTEQFQLIYNLDPEHRVDAIELIRAGKEVDPETGEEKQALEKDPRKVGGYRIRQE